MPGGVVGPPFQPIPGPTSPGGGGSTSPNLTVTVGEVTPDGPTTNFSPNGTASFWGDYVINGRYVNPQGIYMMGVTSPQGFQGGSAAFVQLHAPMLLWAVDWTAMKFQNCPEVPDPNQGDSNWVLLHARMEPAMIRVGADGVTPAYRLSGTYYYGHRNPTGTLASKVVFPIPPYLRTDGVFLRMIPVEKLNPSLIGITQQGEDPIQIPPTGPVQSP